MEKNKNNLKIKNDMELLFLGTGTSGGIPEIACDCHICQQVRMGEQEERTRSSLLISFGEKNILIDTSQDFRTQMIRHNIRHVNSILYTHCHADHVYGLPDIRRFNYLQKETIPCYGSKETIEEMKQLFAYIFNAKQKGGGLPEVEFKEIKDPFELYGLNITPVPVMHGILEIFGFRVGDIAYIPDVSKIPESSKPLLRDLDILIVDALRHEPHETHFSLGQALEVIDELKPKRGLLTHISHRLYEKKIILPENVELAYDGMRIKL